MTVQEITREQATKATTAAKAGQLVQRALRHVQAVRTADESATVSAAYATHAAEVTGYLKECKFSRGTENLTGQQAFAAMFGWRDSHVTLMKTMGYAAVNGLVKPGSVLWQHLAHRGGAGYSDVRKAIHADGATTDSITEALRQRIDPAGKRIASARPDDGSKAGEKGAKAGEKARSEEVVISLVPVQRVEFAVKLLAKNVGDLTPEQWAHTRGRLADILRKEDTLRAKVNGEKVGAKAPAKRTARKTAAKKASAPAPVAVAS